MLYLRVALRKTQRLPIVPCLTSVKAIHSTPILENITYEQILPYQKRARINGGRIPSSYDRLIQSPKCARNPKGRFLVNFNPHTGNRLDITQIQTQNEAHKLRFSKGMLNYVQVLTTPTADTPGTTLLLNFDDKRYVIGNVSEGVQRAAGQRKIGLLKVENIFLTGQTTWRTTGGLLGLILTVADGFAAANASRAETAAKEGKASRPSRRMQIHGTDNLMHTIATARRFVFRKGMPLDIFEGENRPDGTDVTTPSWSDNNVRLWHMDLHEETPRPSSSLSTRSRKRSHEEMYGDEIAVSLDGVVTETLEEKQDRYAQIRRGVVSHMFDSTWKLDALETMKLYDVQPPAAIFVRREGKIEKYDGPTGDDAPNIDVLVRTPWPGALIEDLPPTKPSSISRSYIIKNHNIRGKFKPDVAKKLGVVPPQFKKLIAGESVKTADGTVVTPETCVGVSRVGGSFAVVELPTRGYIDALIKREEWESKEVMEGVGAIFWILGQGVLGDERLAEFQAKFSHLKHIVSSDDAASNGLSFESAAKQQLRLHLVDPERFPVLAHHNEAGELPEGCLPAQVGLRYQLEPKQELQKTDIVQYLDTEKAIQGQEKEFDGLTPEVSELAKTAHACINEPEYLANIEKLQEDLPGKDAEIITLGTGSALPSKYRNVSATLLRVPGAGSYLFDAGENTLGQMKRMFGPELPQILKDLKVIWVSHLHADHHLGTASVMRARQTLDRASGFTFDKLVVSSDNDMLEWLAEYSQVEDIGFHSAIQIRIGPHNKFRKDFSAQETATVGLKNIEGCYVQHCRGALAVILRFPNGFSVAYSGDCRPSDQFARMAHGATVLIHEATFESGMEGEAIAKRHSTTGEALYVAKKMSAKRVMLTHFSQRYPKVSNMEDTGDAIAVSAFDHMRVKVGDFVKMKEFNKAIEKLYETVEEEDK